MDVTNILHTENLIKDVKTFTDNLLYLSFVAGGTVPIPKEIVLGKRCINKIVRMRPKLGRRLMYKKTRPAEAREMF